MPIARREAEIVWEGPLARGTGTLTSGSGALDELAVTWASRTEQPDGKTSPEELIAAAHASCFAMALALLLDENQTPPGPCARERRLHARRGGAARRASRPSSSPSAHRCPGSTRPISSDRRPGGRALPGLQRAARQRRGQRAQRARPRRRDHADPMTTVPPAASSSTRPHSRQEAEVEDLVRALRGYGVLTRARLLDVCGATHWSDAGARRALARAVSSGRIRQLGDDLYEIAEPPTRGEPDDSRAVS